MKVTKQRTVKNTLRYSDIVPGKVYRTDGGGGRDSGSDGRLYLATDEGVADLEDGTHYDSEDSGCDGWVYWEVHDVELVVPGDEE